MANTPHRSTFCRFCFVHCEIQTGRACNSCPFGCFSPCPCSHEWDSMRCCSGYTYLGVQKAPAAATRLRCSHAHSRHCANLVGAAVNEPQWHDVHRTRYASCWRWYFPRARCPTHTCCLLAFLRSFGWKNGEHSRGRTRARLRSDFSTKYYVIYWAYMWTLFDYYD